MPAPERKMRVIVICRSAPLMAVTISVSFSARSRWSPDVLWTGTNPYEVGRMPPSFDVVKEKGHDEGGIIRLRWFKGEIRVP